MHEEVRSMLEKYRLRSTADYVRALREIIQEIALLGLWRRKFFEKAAFYGGTALRVLHGLDRFSDHLDFSLLSSDPDFDLAPYTDSTERELKAFGFDTTISRRKKTGNTAIQSTFFKTDTVRLLMTLETKSIILGHIPRGQVTKIKIEIDTNPAPGFNTEVKYLLNPIPFTVKSYALPDLFAGKMHAVLCRKWKTGVKGRDWYDLVWYVSHHPELNLKHLEQRMRQSGHLDTNSLLSPARFKELLDETINQLDIDRARKEVEPFLPNAEVLDIWSRDFFHDVASRIRY